MVKLCQNLAAFLSFTSKSSKGPNPEGLEALHPEGVDGLPRNVTKTHTPRRTLKPRDITSQKTLKGKSRTNRWGTDVSQRPQGRQRRARQGRRIWGRLRTPEVVGDDDQQRRKWKEAVASLPFPSKFIRGFLF